MATETLYPNTVTSPGGAGGGSCSGTDRARTCDSESECDEGLVKTSADHKTFDSPSYQSYWSSVTLKVDWRTDAQATDERDCVNGGANRGEFKLYYTTNGSTYSYFSGFPRDGFNLAKTGTATLGLSVGQDISKVNVRIVSEAQGDTCPTGRCCYGTLQCDCRIDTQAGCAPGTYGGDGTSCDGTCYHELCDGIP